MPDKANAPIPNTPVPVEPPKYTEHEVPKSFGIGVKPIRVQDPGDDPGNGTNFGLFATPIHVVGPGPGSPLGLNVQPYGVRTTGGSGPRFVKQYGPIIRKGNKELDKKDGKPADPPQGGLLGEIGQTGETGPPGSGGNTGATSAALLPEYVLPAKGAFDPDTRFKLKAPRTHSDLSPLPAGTVCVMAGSTDDRQQNDLLVPTDNRLIAANRGLGFAADFGTRVSDIGLDGEIDTKWTARLQTAWRVLRRPSGILSLDGNRQNSLSWTIGRTGIGDEIGGFVSDGHGSEAVHAHCSVRNGGPFDVGDGAGDFADKHQIGVTWDGQPINALHFSTTALFLAPPSWAKDGPLNFKNAGYDYMATDGTAPQKVHCVYNPQAGYDFGRDGTKRMFGAWDWITYATVYEITDDPPPPPPGTGPTTGGGDGGDDGDPPPPPPGWGPTTGGGGATTGGGNNIPWEAWTNGRPGFKPPLPPPGPPGAPGARGAAGAGGPQGGNGGGSSQRYAALGAWMKEVMAGPLAARPQLLGEGLPDFAHAKNVPQPDRIAFDETAPVSLRQTPFGKQRNGSFLRTQEPGFSSFPGGTVPGGWFFHAPEVGPLDANTDFTPAGVTVSESGLVFGPSVYTAWGTIDPAAGTVDDGVRVIRDGAGSIAIEVFESGSWVTKATLSGSTLNVKTGMTVTLEAGAQVVLGEGVDVEAGTATGTKIGTDALQKVGFFGATPIVQGAAVADATDAASTTARLNDLLARIRASGLIAT